MFQVQLRDIKKTVTLFKEVKITLNQSCTSFQHIEMRFTYEREILYATYLF